MASWFSFGRQLVRGKDYVDEVTENPAPVNIPNYEPYETYQSDARTKHANKLKASRPTLVPTSTKNVARVLPRENQHRRVANVDLRNANSKPGSYERQPRGVGDNFAKSFLPDERGKVDMHKAMADYRQEVGQMLSKPPTPTTTLNHRRQISHIPPPHSPNNNDRVTVMRKALPGLITKDGNQASPLPVYRSPVTNQKPAVIGQPQPAVSSGNTHGITRQGRAGTRSSVSPTGSRRSSKSRSTSRSSVDRRPLH